MIIEDLDFTERGQGLGLGRRFRKADIYGALDFEVIQGKPFTLQIRNQKGHREIFYLEGNSRLARLRLEEIFEDLPKGGLGVFGFYYFKYDIQALFLDRPELFTGIAYCDIEEGNVKSKGVLTWPTVFLILRKDKKKILLFDIFRFYEGGLDKVCRDLRFNLKKLPVPPCIDGQYYPSKKEVEGFEEYALRDVDAGLQIVEEIQNTWESYDLPPKISNAHMAGSIFLKNFAKRPDLPNGDSPEQRSGLDKPDILMQQAALKSYHGGRNSLTVPRLPYIHPHMVYYDISSMYPFCGAYKLPPFFGGRWVWDLDIRGLTGKPFERIDDNGIYKVSGKIEKGDCWPYVLLKGHDGDDLAPGPFQGVWFTGIEIKTALRHGTLFLSRVEGFHWIPGEDWGHPIRSYMEHFYKEKSSNKHRPTVYEHAKKMLNTLYGKFISTIPHYRRDENGKEIRDQDHIYHTPGALFNAPVGSLFTAWSRVLIFESEVKYGSFHAATDSILVPASNPLQPQVTKGIMGGFEKECEGELVVGRNKLYAILDHKKTENFTGIKGKDDNGRVLVVRYNPLEDIKIPNIPEREWYWEGRRIHKFALHAFQGNVLDLLAIVKGYRKTYTARRMGNIRDSLKSPAITPLMFNEFPGMEVNFDGKYGVLESPLVEPQEG